MTEINTKEYKVSQKQIEVLTSLLNQKDEEIRNLKQSNWYFAKEKAKLEEKLNGRVKNGLKVPKKKL